MITTEARNQSRLARIGWGFLVVICVLLVFNGILWFFVGPGIDRGGVSMEEFSQTYPELASTMANNARQVAFWYMAFGSLALLVALEGFRHGSRWAWYSMWIMVVLLAAIGILYRDGFGVIILVLAVIALVCEMVTGRQLSP